MAKDPSFPFYARDWLTATRTLPPIARAAYVDLLAYSWLEGPLPKDLERLRRICAYDREEFESAWCDLRGEFIETEAGYVNERLEAIRAEREAFLAKQAENGRKGGRPRKDEKPNENPNATQTITQRKPKRNPNHNPNESSASAFAFAERSEASASDAAAQVSTDPPEPPPRKPNAAWDEASGVLSAVCEELGWDPPIEKDVRRHLKPDGALRQLVALFGTHEAAAMFCHAFRAWKGKVSWEAVFDKRNILRSEMANGPNGAASLESVTRRMLGNPA